MVKHDLELAGVSVVAARAVHTCSDGIANSPDSKSTDVAMTTPKIYHTKNIPYQREKTGEKKGKGKGRNGRWYQYKVKASIVMGGLRVRLCYRTTNGSGGRERYSWSRCDQALL